MSKLYGIICSSGRQMYSTERAEDGSRINVPSWFTRRADLVAYFSPLSDKVVILNTETLEITLEDHL